MERLHFRSFSPLWLPPMASSWPSVGDCPSLSLSFLSYYVPLPFLTSWEFKEIEDSWSVTAPQIISASPGNS